MGTFGRLVALLGGSAIGVWVLLAAVRTVVLPRGEPVLLTRWVFVAMRSVFNLWGRRAKTYEELDRSLALYAPMALVALPWAWVTLVIAGFTSINWALGVDPLRRAFFLSGSSLLTLGFDAPPDLPTHVVAFVEALFGLGLIALLISYLPSIYSAFQRRELEVTRLTTRAGSPPSAITMIRRHHALARLDALDEIWDEWETWFADVEETHTSQPSLVFFRSITHDRSWITSAGAVLDAAALRSSVLNLPQNARAQLCLRSGYLCLRRIADFYSIPYDADPSPDDPISIDRSEFDAAYEELAGFGVPVRPQRDQCWREFKGWRVNYDTVLLGLAGLTAAPYAPWSSDRSQRYRRPPLTRMRRAR
ncbi:MAG: hypothetical protein QOG80_36 [Pseudonocardiales bacterium]|nr:hypothetical protein [Pseudonocardiales bacterium]